MTIPGPAGFVARPNLSLDLVALRGAFYAGLRAALAGRMLLVLAALRLAIPTGLPADLGELLQARRILRWVTSRPTRTETMQPLRDSLGRAH